MNKINRGEYPMMIRRKFAKWWQTTGSDQFSGDLNLFLDALLYYIQIKKKELRTDRRRWLDLISIWGSCDHNKPELRFLCRIITDKIDLLNEDDRDV